MSCEKYKSTLIEAAVSGGESPRVTGLRTHVESCAACAADLSQQRALVDAMEVNLHRQMNAPVPAGMLRRLEAHLAQQPQKMRKPRLTLIFASTVATLAIAAVVVLLLPHKGARTVDVKRTIPPAANFV